MFSDVTPKPHGLREVERQEKFYFFFYISTFPNIEAFSYRPVPTHLSILNGVCSGLLKQLDGLVVVQGAAASDHVPQELHAVQLPVRVLRSGVVYEADLRMKRRRLSLETQQL